MKLRMVQVDAFTDRLFAGNPAAVVLLEEDLADPVLLRIAAENNLSETAFVRRDGDAWNLRWFTPEVEVDLCGHATLATSFVLFRDGLATGETIRFRTRSGELRVAREGELLAMDFPAWPPEPRPDDDALTAGLGARPVEVLAARDVVAVFDDEEDVAGLHPDMDRLRSVDAIGVIATAPGRSADFVSRFFAPRVGVPEDPVTGSAHCTLVPFWAERLGKTSLHARQISRRGGDLYCDHLGERVLLRGHAVEYLRGTIRLPA